ncbi:MAG: hypothetical protein KDD43_08765 [Bdellovibrionales bacterium]|nr:hypothetical protein [Bdellovibrionales bacterium]
MADWRMRAEISADVAFFPYVTREVERRAREVYVWDLDKTYLDTRFETLGGLWRTVVEKAFQKKNVPGTGALARALKKNWEEIHEEAANEFAIYFITASPPQLERKIYEKLVFDGIYPFGIYFKDNLQNLQPKRWWRLTQQVGYKLQALLSLRLRLDNDVRFVMWGDDSESDAVIYSLFSDICTRRLETDELREVMKSLHVVGSQMDVIFDLQEQIPSTDPVDKVYINLAEDTDADYYVKFGRRTLPTYCSFQTALDLFQDKRLDGDLVVRVAQDLITNFGYTYDELERYLDDMIRRQRIGEEALVDLLPVLQGHGLIHPKWEPSIAPKPIADQVDGRVMALEGSYEPWVPERIDYLHDYR